MQDKIQPFVEAAVDLGDDFAAILKKLGFSSSEAEKVTAGLDNSGMFDGLNIRGVWKEGSELRVAEDTGVQNDAGHYVVRFEGPALESLKQTVADSVAAGVPFDTEGKPDDVKQLIQDAVAAHVEEARANGFTPFVNTDSPVGSAATADDSSSADEAADPDVQQPPSEDTPLENSDEAPQEDADVSKDHDISPTPDQAEESDHGRGYRHGGLSANSGDSSRQWNGDIVMGQRGGHANNLHGSTATDQSLVPESDRVLDLTERDLQDTPETANRSMPTFDTADPVQADFSPDANGSTFGAATAFADESPDDSTFDLSTGAPTDGATADQYDETDATDQDFDSELDAIVNDAQSDADTYLGSADYDADQVGQQDEAPADSQDQPDPDHSNQLVRGGGSQTTANSDFTTAWAKGSSAEEFQDQVQDIGGYPPTDDAQNYTDATADTQPTIDQQTYDSQSQQADAWDNQFVRSPLADVTAADVPQTAGSEPLVREPGVWTDAEMEQAKLAAMASIPAGQASTYLANPDGTYSGLYIRADGTTFTPTDADQDGQLDQDEALRMQEAIQSIGSDQYGTALANADSTYSGLFVDRNGATYTPADANGNGVEDHDEHVAWYNNLSPEQQANYQTYGDVNGPAPVSSGDAAYDSGNADYGYFSPDIANTVGRTEVDPSGLSPDAAAALMGWNPDSTPNGQGTPSTLPDTDMFNKLYEGAQNQDSGMWQI